MSDQSFLANLFAWSVQVALVTGVAAAVLAVLRVRVPSIRYHWWRAVLAFCLVLPLIQPWRTPDGRGAAIEAATAVPEPLTQTEILAPPGPDERPAVPGLPAAGETWPAAIILLLIAGAALRFAWLGAGILRLRRLRGAGERAEPTDGHAEVQKLTEAGAEIRYVKVLGQPVTFGVRRPIVLLPDSLRTLPEPVQRAVLAHELWHVQRRDWAWILVEECVRTLLWFHPAIWYLVSRVQASREEVVDELTVLLTNSRRTYLEALLAFADEPPLFAAAPFATRRHLFQRMLLISKEAVMSSRRIIASSAALAATVFLAGWSGAAAFPLTGSPAAPEVGLMNVQQPPRDHRPGDARPATSREQELQSFVAREPNGPASKAAYLEIAKLQEARGATAEAEATLHAARAAFPADLSPLNSLAQLYSRTGDFDRAVAVMEEAAAQDPSNPRGHHVVATYYQEKVQKDRNLSAVDQMMYIRKGIEAADRALMLDPDYRDALVYKNILLRHQARLETDPSAQAALIAEADALRSRALELTKTRGRAVVGDVPPGAPPPPPPPPPPSADPVLVNGQVPVRIGGEIKPPVKIHDVRPVYPPIAESSRVQGVVIIEATLDEAGNVYDARVLRSIPLLDDAALEAVRQWKFAPTLQNGVPVPVILTVTVNFTLQ